MTSLAHGKTLKITIGIVADQCSCRFPQYAQSKLCNVLFTAELQRRLQQRGIVATSVSPGFVNTTIFRWGGGLLCGKLCYLMCCASRMHACAGVGAHMEAGQHADRT
jgi:NAD(P)-dependent dehydrogenase (short-subunit alcohol dehydrogenase family)